jgi:site-specific recombinase XerD
LYKITGGSAVQELIIAKQTRKESQVVLIEKKYDPVILYIKSLNSDASQKQMAKILFSFSRWYFSNDSSSPQDVQWKDVNFLIVSNYQQHLFKVKKLQPATVNNYINAVKGVLRKSARIRDIAVHNKISIEDFEEIKEVKPISSHREPKGRALSKTESIDIFNVCADDSIQGIRDLAISMTFIFCGLRLNELCELEYPDCIVNDKHLKILGKRNKQRLVPINKKAKLAITAWVDNVRGTQKGPLFCRIWRSGELNDESALSHSGIRYILKKRSLKAGGESFSPHDLRRTFGTRLLENNVDIFVVQTLLGHSSVDTTRSYDKRGVEVQENAVELL